MFKFFKKLPAGIYVVSRSFRIQFEYKTGGFIMHAKRGNKQGENGTAGIWLRAIILGSYCFLLCEQAC